jgi:hypothetical protein
VSDFDETGVVCQMFAQFPLALLVAVGWGVTLPAERTKKIAIFN